MNRLTVCLLVGLCLVALSPLCAADSAAPTPLGPIMCWVDADEDGFGNPNAPDPKCGPGTVMNDGDCDDSNSSTYPGAFDNPIDMVDSNCDGFDYDAGADTDSDTRTDGVEDTNQNGHVNDDDFDGDASPNYLDIDDDGDSVLTQDELDEDTDADGLPNFVDIDDDNDSVLTIDEDPDGNNNPADDDTDADGAPDYVDMDDDDDSVLTLDEYNGGEDADGDGLPNYRDIDDDDDSVLTIDEDPNGNNNPADDDTDADSVPNFLDPDDDNDGIPTIGEDFNGNGDPTDDDLDGDMIPDYLDADSPRYFLSGFETNEM